MKAFFMYCVKCGKELNDEDLFCSKCGTKVVVVVSSAQTSAAMATKSSSKPVLKHGFKLPRKKVSTSPNLKLKALPLVVNGACRHCGRRLALSATTCPDCGAGNGRISMSMSEVERATKLGQGLGPTSLLEWLDTFDSASGCLFAPLILVNPLFWIQWSYKLKAKEALKEGKIDLAEEYKATSTKFAVAGWIITIVVLVLLGSQWA